MKNYNKNSPSNKLKSETVFGQEVAVALSSKQNIHIIYGVQHPTNIIDEATKIFANLFLDLNVEICGNGSSGPGTVFVDLFRDFLIDLNSNVQFIKMKLILV